MARRSVYPRLTPSLKGSTPWPSNAPCPSSSPTASRRASSARSSRRFETNGLKPVAIRLQHLSQREAEGFYAVHKERPFFKDLVAFMISGPVVLMCLEGENAVLKNRELMGATDPKKAASRAPSARTSPSRIDANTVHGSDSVENAKNEIAYFFRATELSSLRLEALKSR